MINHISKKRGSRFLLVALIATSIACSKENFQTTSSSSTLGGSGSGSGSNWSGWWSSFTGIFSNRAQLQNRSVVLIQFKSPPLLSSLQVDPNGVKVVDSDLRLAIDSEQAAAMTSLKNLSSDIVVLYRYRMVLNAMAIVVPNNVLDKLDFIGGVSFIEGEGTFARPRLIDAVSFAAPADLTQNPVKFIGADVVHKMMVKNRSGVPVPLDGTGMRVGVIDTGIDYTHLMLGGAGTDAAFKAVDPSKLNSAFPTAKVVGGIDFAGSNYDSASANLDQRIPVADPNPIDEAGHGSHVAGTIAGVGDGVNTYDGVAPGAKLYAIKVFGATGSAGDAVVIAGLEYAADPTGQADPNQQLDAVNLSLGGTYGNPHILYQEAIGNLTRAGTVVLTAAGNEGALDYVVGAPSVSNDALSIAASVDNAPQNWQFPAVKFTFAGGSLISQAIPSPIAVNLDTVGNLSGTLVAAGLADTDFSDDLKAQLKGKVAFIDRGLVAFGDKIQRAQEAGAIGVVVANNQPGDPIAMGGTGAFLVPAVMISQSAGDALKDKMKLGDVTVMFNTPEKIMRKELIDTIADFSSKGPRSFDSAIKPEISAPGQNVISISMGTGAKGVQMSGTSMATPHMTGVLTLLKQLHPDLSVTDLKSLVMSTAKRLSDTQGNEYPVSVQGAGRVQVDKAVLAQAVTEPAAISLGEQNLSAKKTIRTTIFVRNISNTKITFVPTFHARSKGIQMLATPSLTLAGGDSGPMTLNFSLDTASINDPVQELDGFVILKTDGAVDLSLPVLAVVKKISAIKAEQLVTHSSAEDAAGSAVDLKLKNTGANPGDVMAFNLLGLDTRKSNPLHSPFVDTSCNLQAAGYRIITKNIFGQSRRVIQFAAKLYQPETTWNMCEISVLIDKDGKGIASQELSGIALKGVPGLAGDANSNQFTSVLFDAAKVRDLRKQFETASQQKSSSKPTEDYQAAVIDENDMMAINHTTVAVIEAPLDELMTAADGQLSVRMATILDNVSVPQSDDFLEKSASQWTRLSLMEDSQAYLGMPEKTTLIPGQEMTLSLTKGFGSQELLLLFPQNANVFSDTVQDGQGQILKSQFSP
jgi:subtilisin family serine protease